MPRPARAHLRRETSRFMALSGTGGRMAGCSSIGQPEGSLDRAGRADLVRGDERDDGSVRARPAGTAGAVHVVLVVAGRVEVEHAGDVLDVDAAGGDVGGDEHAGRAGVERLQRPVALGLGAAAVQGDGSYAGRWPADVRAGRRRDASGRRRCELSWPPTTLAARVTRSLRSTFQNR